MPTPFEVTPEQILRLGPRFTTFINKLLEVERVAQGLAGHALTVTSNEDASDKGVDAMLRGSGGSSWTPPGDTAFQFKRSSQSATDCANELANATNAKSVLQAGGSYVMALGGDNVADSGIQDRRRALVDKAIELKILREADEGHVKVYDANALARWASEYPALAIDPILEGVQVGAIDLGRWRQSRVHEIGYVIDQTREAQISDLRLRLLSHEPVDIRLQGESGIGKTRLVLEAVDDARLGSLVAYIDDDAHTGGGLIESLIDLGRQAIIVVDECPADRHVKLTAKLPTNPNVKLITIGDIGASRSSGPVIGLTPLADDAMDELLNRAYPGISAEARRFVRDHSHGAPGWALWLGKAVRNSPDAQAADMISRNDIEQFVSTYLPEGKAFFFAAVLALFERVGWDRDLQNEKELLADFAGADPKDFDDVALDLTAHGLLKAQGRFRAIDPLPAAIFLAAEAWRQFGRRIRNELLPTLTPDMARALFRRAAQLGRFEPAVSALPGLLAADGMFGSLRRIESTGTGELLTQLAIVLPDEVTVHLALLIEEATLEELRDLHNSRRSLVWTLEKLVWHSRTFERAADGLLRLALAEIESFANNATGTWIELFGGALPGTAASPSQRATYLEMAADDTRADVRLLVVRATERPLGSYESIAVSGEVQGGVLVERRGSPTTWPELGEYRRRLLLLLEALTEDTDAQVAHASTDRLIASMHSLIDDPYVGDDLANILASLQGEHATTLRREIEHLRSLHLRHGNSGRNIVPALERLRDRLPPANAAEELAVLAGMRRWDLGEAELDDRISRSLTALPDGVERVRDLLAVERPAAWELGRGLATIYGESSSTLRILTELYPVNPNALVGYLNGLVERGDESSFDRFLAGDEADPLDDRARLAIAVRGPVTTEARARVLSGIHQLEVRDAVATLFGWGRNLAPAELAELVTDWTATIQTQDDYDALIDWVNLTLPSGPIEEEHRPSVWSLVRRRSEFPNLGREEWGWAQLAERVADEAPSDLLSLLLGLMADGAIMVHSGDDDARIINRCLRADPAAGWQHLGKLLQREDAWRLTMQLRAWAQFAVPVEIVTAWIGGDVERARIVASFASPGGSEPSELAVALLGDFGDDDEVRGSLRATFLSGGWVGPWSDRLTRQIGQLRSWQSKSGLPTGVRRWAKETADLIYKERETVLEREAERGY